MMTEITEKLNDADHGRAVMGNSVVSWIGFNLVMLVLYLGFFYMCLAVEYPRSLVIGLVIAVVMSLLCFCYYRLFVNRYEFWFYLVLPLDVVMESFVAEHTGYSFYWCALGFWTVFVLYRVCCLLRGRPNTSAPAPEESSSLAQSGSAEKYIPTKPNALEG